MKHCFILNPAAGHKEQTGQVSETIRQSCDGRGVEYEIYLTTCVGDATEYVKRRVAQEPEEDFRFYACGGDGTLNEVVRGAKEAEGTGEIAVGLIPSGTGNDFVRNFTCGEKFFDIDAQLDGKTVQVDLIRCNDRYAVNVVNVGFDCEVVVKMEQLRRKKWVPSGMQYIVGLILTFFRKPSIRCCQSVSGGEYVDRQYLLNTFANGCFYGGGFHSNPKAELQDGRLDALFVKNIGRIKFVSMVGSYKKGTHLVPKYESILHNEKIDRADMTFEGGANVSVDGEVIRVDELHLSVCPRALTFLIPAGSEMRKPAKQEAAAAAQVL